VNTHSVEKKRQILNVVFSSLTKVVLSSEVISPSLTTKPLLLLSDAKEKCLYASWHLTFNCNHWSSMNSYKDFMNTILTNYKID